MTIWENIKTICKWIITLAALCAAFAWVFTKLASLGETGVEIEKDRDTKKAEDVMRPPPRPSKW